MSFPANRTNANAGVRTYVGIKSHYASSDRAPIVDLYFFRGGYIGIAPVEGNRLNVAALVTSSAFQSFGASSALERIVDDACNHVPALRERLADARPLTETRSATSPVHVRRRPSAWSDMACIGRARGHPAILRGRHVDGASLIRIMRAFGRCVSKRSMHVSRVEKQIYRADRTAFQRRTTMGRHA